MTSPSAHEVGKRLLDLNLLTRDQWLPYWNEAGEMSGDDLIELLQKKGALTALQTDKLRRGDDTGYFLGRFKILYKISAGTFARVYRGVDSATGATVAVKVLRGRHTQDPESVKQFHREAKLTENLQHPNVVRTLEVGADKPSAQHYIAMEFVEGGNLREMLKIRHRFDPLTFCKFAIEMAEGLEYALSRGVTHRDIKPTNILLSLDGHIRWVDFGLAGVTEARGMASFKADEQLQRTVDYAGLERLCGSPKGDPRSDIFFLGSVFYHMLVGEPAMQDTRDRNERASKARFVKVVPCRDRPEVPRQLADIVDKALTIDLEGRYQNYESMLRDLRLAKAELERLEADPEEASVQKALAGFPPGTPRVVIVHAKTRLHDELKGKLERRGIAAVCTADLGRAVMLHEMRPFHCMILDLATTGRDGLKAYAKQKKRSYDRGLKLGGIFLAAEEAERADVDKLGLDLTLTLVGQPVTLSQLKDALDTLMPGSVRPRKDGADDDS